MSENTNKEITSDLVKRDLKLSVLTSPATFIIPILSYIFLYPIILSRSSIVVLGIWSLYVTTASFFTVADLGFSQHFMREAGRDRDKGTLRLLKEELATANRFYFFIGLSGLIFVFLLRDILFNPVANIYSPAGLLFSALVLIAGTTLLLISSLNGAILSARADNYYVKLIRSVSPVFTYTFAIIGALIKLPIEGFAAGTLLANSFLVLVYRNRIKKRHNDWHSIQISLSVSQTKERLKDLLKKGWKLYSVSVGMIIRQPILRYVIAFSIGLPAAGVFDIAIRITATSRDVIASGFGSLYPSLSFFFRNNERNKILEVMRTSLMLLIPIGVVVAVILIFNSGFIYRLWLKSIPAGVIIATGILAVWQLMTIANIPFWYLLQAAHLEKVAAIAIWAHTFFILLLIPISLIRINLALNEILIYWTITAVITQCLIYVSAERKLAMFWEVFRKNQIILVLVLSTIYILLGIVLQNYMRSFVSPEIITLVLTIIFILILVPIYLPILKRNLSLKNL